MIGQDEFGQLVRDALARLYDSIYLQNHPLIGLLDLQSPPWGTAAEALRILLRDTIDSLKPPSSVPADWPEWLGYSILSLRYARLLSESEICQELNISAATFYRRQREALDALVSVLWNRYEQAQARADDVDLEAVESLTADEVRSRAIRLAGTSARQPVDLMRLLHGVRNTILPLAREKGVVITMDLPPSLPMVYAHASVLRQIYLGVLTEGIGAWPKSPLELCVRPKRNEVVSQLRSLHAPGEPESSLTNRAGFGMSQALLDLYRGRLWFEQDADGGQLVLLSFPAAAPRTVLVIDDDAATSALYRRYLERQSYVVLEAQTLDDAEAWLADNAPDLILLDVMMPQTDGWTVLQTLKARPQTAQIPVVVCSVIDQPALALALGAAQVLTKPISPYDLLQAVETHLALPGAAHGDINGEAR